MQIDQEYFKGLLEAFEASDSPDTDIIRLNDLGSIVKLTHLCFICVCLRIEY
jgi:hypothetical protein